MNVVVVIDGREAVPVRAIPLLTDWKVMWPDATAKALDEFYFDFEGLRAYRLEDGVPKPLKATWWQEFAVRNLKALSNRIETEQVTHDVGYQKWRKESLAELPAGVFVWKDEYVPMYQGRYGPDALARSLGRELTESERQARELDFAHFVSAEYAALVKEGFEPQAAPVQPGAGKAITPQISQPEQAETQTQAAGGVEPDQETWVMDEDYSRLWHALRLDEERMKKPIEALERASTASSAEVVLRMEKLEA